MGPICWTKGELCSRQKQLIVAVDHGMSFPDMDGLERPLAMLGELASDTNVDGVIAAPGLYKQAQRSQIPLAHLNRLITVDVVGTKQQAGKTLLTQRRMILSPDEAADYDVDCFKLFFNIYPDKERLIDNALDMTRFVNAGQRRGVSTLAEILYYENDAFLDPRTQVRQLFNGCRMAMELGADVLKIPLIPDQDAIGEIIDRLGLPTFILGGNRYPSEERLTEDIRGICQKDICGIMFGRNIWQSAHPHETIALLRAEIDAKGGNTP